MLIGFGLVTFCSTLFTAAMAEAGEIGLCIIGIIANALLICLTIGFATGGL